MRVVLGGTFDPLHVGHERLLERALEAAGPDGTIHIGLVSDAYSAQKRKRQVTSYAEREAAIAAWFEARHARGQVTIRPLDDAYGPSATGEYDAMIVSPETTQTATELNHVRRANGLPALELIVVPYALAADLLPVSGTRVRAGSIDRAGKRLTPLVVAVGSENPVKVEAVRRAFERFLPGLRIDAHGIPAQSGVPEQPWDEEGPSGASSRAAQALQRGAPRGAEYGVGIEAALHSTPRGLFDVQHCAIRDASGFETHGQGPGFAYPARIEAGLRSRTKTVSDVISPLAGDPAIGRKQGAVGWLTGGRLDRTRLTEAAVEAALVPRCRSDLRVNQGARASP